MSKDSQSARLDFRALLWAILVIIAIAVIGSNVMLIFATVHPVGLQTRTHWDLEEIQYALEAYKNERGHYPVVNRSEAEQPIREMLAVLCGWKNAQARELNPDGHCYLKRLAVKNKGGSILDPWGRPYHIALDVTGNGTINLGGIARTQSVFVWSNGRNGTNEWGAGDDMFEVGK